VGNVVVENATLFNVSAQRVTLGLNANASGLASIAMGNGTTASGSSSTALGYLTIASGLNSTALGYNTKATNDYSTAMGYNTTASGLNSTAMGYNTTASGMDSTALGYFSTANGNYSAALGYNTTASGNSSTAMGELSTASGNSSTAMGSNTKATNDCSTAMGAGTIAGGYISTAMGAFSTAGGYASTAMGESTTASGYRSTALGHSTTAGGDSSTAMGSFSQATNAGCLVWSDNSFPGAASISDNSVTMQASGGYRLFSSSGMSAGVSLAPGDTAWATLSDQNAKKNFAPVNGAEVLAKLAGVPVQQWNYKWEQDSAVPNIGPMAQAFKAAFYPGRDDKSITTLEFDGVELAAIQALNEKLEAENYQLRQRLANLEVIVQQLAHGREK
jgi:hypothetical protein